MSKSNLSKIEKRSTEGELLKKPIEVLAKYVIYLEDEWLNFSKENQGLKKRVAELEKQKREVEKPKTDNKKYNKKSSWMEKLVFILKENGKPMSVREIKNQFFFLEPEIKFQWTDADNQISQLLHRACAAKVTTKRKVKGEFRYFN
jgi:uncharacterized protein YdhG (YjbR/CyaY superfamily)